MLYMLSSSLLCVESPTGIWNKPKKDDHCWINKVFVCMSLTFYAILPKSLNNKWLLFLFNRQLLSLPLSLSEEELLRMRQELHCCFSQVDSSLAWPKIRARTLLQAFEVEQRDTEVLKVEQNLAVTSKQVGTVWDQCGDVEGVPGGSCGFWCWLQIWVCSSFLGVTAVYTFPVCMDQWT